MRYDEPYTLANGFRDAVKDPRQWPYFLIAGLWAASSPILTPGPLVPRVTWSIISLIAGAAGWWPVAGFIKWYLRQRGIRD
jgi:hypothetical protein